MGKVDAVFLGYAVCQSLKGIVDILPIPSVMLDADDCIGVFLTPANTRRKRRSAQGLGSIALGGRTRREGANKELHLDCLKD